MAALSVKPPAESVAFSRAMTGLIQDLRLLRARAPIAAIGEAVAPRATCDDGASALA